ncbi:MAG: CD225/dispanin family protein [Sphingobacteriaceae bacterium]|nr:CD225/dispanin family protein [Cytophagaceae bacterium]
MEPTPYPSAPIGSPKPKNYLVETIVASVVGLLCCCGFNLIPGVIGIVFSTQVDSKYNAGDYAGAASSANTAKILFYVTAGMALLGLISNVIYFLVAGASLFSNLQQNGFNFPR